MANPKGLKKISINLPEHLIEKLDSYAANVGISRTTAILIFCADGLGAIEMQKDKEETE